MLRKALSITLALVLLIGAPLTGTNVSDAKAVDSFSTQQLSMPNDDMLIEMMIKTGKVSKDASSKEINEALNKYLSEVAKPFQKNDGELASKEAKRNLDLILNNKKGFLILLRAILK